jgi:hypothetical protein
MLMKVPVQFKVPKRCRLFYMAQTEDGKVTTFYRVNRGVVEMGTFGRQPTDREQSMILDWMAETFHQMQRDCQNFKP